MDRKALAAQIVEKAYLEGRFVLRSGMTSSYYLDKYRFECHPEILAAITDHMVGLLPKAFDKLAGMELGGVPLATRLSLLTDKLCLFVRKKAKTYGTCNLVEGGFVGGERAVVIEDVISTAGQVCQSIGEMRKLGLVVHEVLCVVDRQQGGGENLEAIDCRLRALYTWAELNELTGGHLVSG
jgi:orotate phosphoribosyltransferase